MNAQTFQFHSSQHLNAPVDIIAYHILFEPADNALKRGVVNVYIKGNQQLIIPKTRVATVTTVIIMIASSRSFVEKSRTLDLKHKLCLLTSYCKCIEDPKHQFRVQNPDQIEIPVPPTHFHSARQAPKRGTMKLNYEKYQGSKNQMLTTLVNDGA